MYIDFHTHAYAEKVAERALHKLVEESKVDVHTDGRIFDTRQRLNEWGIDLAVMHPIATKPSQTVEINNWANKHNKGNIIFFGTVHPDFENVEGEIERVKEMGLKGIKLHPDYQDFYLFEDRAKPIFRKCQELGLMVIIHMGYDPHSPFDSHAVPSDLANLAEEFPSLRFIGAHMGGMFSWERVIHTLKGAPNVYFDTAYTAGNISVEMMTRMVNELSADKILFGSDLPWHCPLDEIKLIKSLPISEESKEKILYKNAAELLGLKNIDLK